MKSHLVLNHNGYVPAYAVIELAKKPELKAARAWR